MSYTEAAPILAAIREDLWPADLQGQTAQQIEAAWPGWVARHDAAVRGRVAEGDDDSLVHLLLFGTSFTTRARATQPEVAGLALDPEPALASLRPRIDDFLAAVAAPGDNDRLEFARQRLAHHGIDPGTVEGQARGRAWLEARAAQIGGDAPSRRLLEATTDASDARTLFRDRGLSSDTTIFIDHGIDRALEAMKDQRLLRDGSVRRVAIIGPGLDVVDKQNGYDFYPQQTIQPFAVVDSLRRFGLADAARLQVTAFDLSPRVLQHLDAARAAAGRGRPYTLVLPRNLDRPWAPGLVDYWQRLGNFIEGDLPPGSSRKPQEESRKAQEMTPPAGAGRVQVRSVVVPPDVVRSIAPRDLNIVVQHPGADEEPFDLVVATNILLYYGVFEQSLAVANIARMLRPGGVLLSNNPVFELPGSPVTAAGHTDTIYMSLPGIGETGDRVMWYQRQ